MGEAAARFWYSNGWWQIECTFASPERVAGKVENCRRISDGVRYGTSVPQEFRGTTDKVWPTAKALAIPFPPPPRVELFVTWLALCPDPELPVIDSKRIRRLNLPQLLDHPKNIGTFSSRMLESGGSFLSELIVTNNGILFGPNETPTQYPGPFADGFVETTFEATERTNVWGISFPLHATLSRFSPRLGGKNREDLRLGAITRLDVTKIGGLDTEELRGHAAPTLVVALDRRAPKLPDGITVNHIVTNDEWLPAKDPRMKALVAAYTGAQKPQTNPHWIVRGILVLTILLPASIYLLRWTSDPDKEE